MKMKRTKRILAVMLSFLLLLTAVPFTALAGGGNPAGDYYRRISSVSQMVEGARYLIVFEEGSCALDGSLGEDMDTANNDTAPPIKT